MANSLMQSPDFNGFEDFGHPFGLILYYIFTFVVMVVLLNILIALYNSAYQDIYDNANDEYLALFAQKTMQFVRAPDENVFIAPFNLIEVFCLAIPLEWWMPKHQYERLNDAVMAVLYSPLLLVAAAFETQSAREIRANRARGEDDDDTVEEWEQMAHEVDFESDGWKKTVDTAKTNLEVDQTALEMQRLRAEVEKLTGLVMELTRAIGSGNGGEGDGEKKAGGFSRSSTVSTISEVLYDSDILDISFLLTIILANPGRGREPAIEHRRPAASVARCTGEEAAAAAAVTLFRYAWVMAE